MRRETRNSVLLIGGTGTTAALSMVYSVYVGRVLGPADYADFTTAISLVFLFTLALGPINGTVTRFTAQYMSRGELGKVQTLSREVGRRVSRYGLIIGLAALLAVRPLADALQFRSAAPLVLGVGLIYLTLLLNVPRGVLRGAQAFGGYTANVVLEGVLRLGAGVGLIWAWQSATSALAAYVVALATILALGWVQERGVWGTHEPQAVDGWAVRRFSVAMLLYTGCTAGYQNVDMLLVKYHFGAAEAGLFGSAFTLSRAISALVTPFGILLLPQMTDLHERGRQARGAFLRSCAGFLVLSSAPLVIFGVWPRAVLSTLYGPQFVDAAPLLFGLAASRVAMYLVGMSALAHAARNDFRFLLILATGLAMEAGAICIWHRTLREVVVTVLAVQIPVLLAMLVFTLTTARPVSVAMGEGPDRNERAAREHGNVTGL